MPLIGKSSFLGRYGEEILAGAAGGVLMALSFPPYPTRILSLVALVPLFRYFLRVRPAYPPERRTLRRGFLVGWIFGIVFFIVLLFWITNLIPASSVSLRWVLTPGLILLTMYLGLYTGLFTLALAALHRWRGAAALFLAPAIWAVTEQMRSSGELAFSWGTISSSLAPYPVALQGLAAAGPFGLGMCIVLINLLFTLILFGRKRTGRAGAAVVLVALIAAALAGGEARIRRIEASLESESVPADVAVVQPNVDLAKKWKAFYRDSVFVEIGQYADKASALGARLVIFPETAAPVSMSHHLLYRDWMKRIARGADLDIYIGYVRHEKEGERWISYNSSGLFDSTGLLVAQYDKINLLQFGERIPFSQYIPPLEKMDFGQANFRRGQEQTIFDSPAGRFGALICFESTFSDYTRRYVRRGADFLVNVTNDGWFGSSRGPLQHSESAIMRAVENGVTMLRAANTGVSMYIDPTGRVVDRIGLDREGMLLVPVHKPHRMTLYTRYGRAVLLVLVLVNIAAVVPFLLRRPAA
jgi:apolipoprotein N-acyltransferase